jgi:hypothetical protein
VLAVFAGSFCGFSVVFARVEIPAKLLPGKLNHDIL